MKIQTVRIIVPNVFTSMNVLLGFCAVALCLNVDALSQSTERYFILAGWLIIAAGIIDGLDGKIARLMQCASSFGIQYDSMADIVAFGFAPSVLLYSRFFIDLPLGFIAFPILYLLCGAIRLARFNVTTDGKKKTCFYGLPIPSAAGIVVAYVFFIDFCKKYGLLYESSSLILIGAIAIIVMTSTLMVTTIEFDVMFKFLFKGFSTFTRVLIVIAIVTGLWFYPGPTLALIGIIYVSKALIRWIWVAITGKEEIEEEASEY